MRTEKSIMACLKDKSSSSSVEEINVFQTIKTTKGEKTRDNGM